MQIRRSARLATAWDRTFCVLRGAAQEPGCGGYASTRGAAPTDCAVVGDIPETRYAKTDDGAHIAFQVLGDGPPDLVFMAEGASNVEFTWEIPAYDRVFRRLASFGRLIRFDTRGSGLSDPLGLSEQLSLEGQAKDMLTVLDAAGAERAAVVANSGSGLLAIFFAASYPNRTSSLVLDGCYRAIGPSAGLPLGSTAGDARAGHRRSRRRRRFSGARACPCRAQRHEGSCVRGAVAAPQPVDVVRPRGA